MIQFQTGTTAQFERLRYNNDAVRIYGLLLMSNHGEPADIELLQIKAGLIDQQKKWEDGISSLVQGGLLAINGSTYYIGNKQFNADQVKSMWEDEDKK